MLKSLVNKMSKEFLKWQMKYGSETSIVGECRYNKSKANEIKKINEVLEKGYYTIVKTTKKPSRSSKYIIKTTTDVFHKVLSENDKIKLEDRIIALTEELRQSVYIRSLRKF